MRRGVHAGLRNRTGSLLLAVCLLAGLAAGCLPSRRDEAPAAVYRSRRTFAVAPVQPRMTAYKGMEVDYDGRAPAPALPPVAGAGRRGGFPGGPMAGELPAYEPGGFRPLEELVYGGAWGDPGADRPYALAVGDRLALVVEGHPELSGPLEVHVDGTVELPLVRRRVPAAGKTVEALRPLVIETLADYARDPDHVTLAVDHAGGRCYYVFGAVARPGRYPMGLRPIRASEAILRANSTPATGPDATPDAQVRAETTGALRTDFAAPAGADLARVQLVTPHPTHPTRRPLDVGGALVEGRTGADPYLRAGQILFVPSTDGSPEAQAAWQRIARLDETAVAHRP